MSHNDRWVALLLIVVGIIAVVVLLLTTNDRGEQTTRTDTVVVYRQNPSYATPHARDNLYYNAGSRRVETFAFDPNSADSTTLLRLGLSPWQVRSIYRYRAKGGIYRRPEDFARVYGLTKGDYARLRPYIRIADRYQPAAEALPEDTVRRPAKPHVEKLQTGEHIDLNTADTAQLRRVPGIGPYFAQQIVYQRRRLGGFTDVNQLRDIKDFPEQALAYLQVKPGAVKQININRATFNQLRQHPYVSYYLARGIVDYRRLHGNISSLDQLRTLPKVSAADLERVRPYITY